MAKISSNQYAEAFIQATANRKLSHEKAVEHFITLINKNGDWSKRKDILETCEKLLRKKDGRELVVIESARPLTKDQRAHVEKMFHSKKADFEEYVNPEAIAGVKIIIDSENEFDGTLKHKLDSILEKV